MKKIEAIIRPEKLAAVRAALAEVGIIGMTLTEVSGAGREKSYPEIVRGVQVNIDAFAKIKIELILEDKMVDECIQVIIDASRSGQIGDGKIIVSPIDKFVNIRTGEVNGEAL